METVSGTLEMLHVSGAPTDPGEDAAGALLESILSLNRDQFTGEKRQYIEEVALKCIRPDSGGNDIKVILRMMSVLRDAGEKGGDRQLFCSLLDRALASLTDTTFALHFLCAFSDRIFSEDLEQIYRLCFWSRIHTGLAHSCSLTRKRALFLLKRFTDSKLPVDPVTPSFTLFDGLDAGDWEQYFLVLEALEEKQLHLVEQVFSLVGLLATRLHPVWTFILFRRFFAHQNLAVVKWGVETFLQLQNLRCGQFGGELREIVTTDLLQVLNESQLYSDTLCGRGICALVARFLNASIQQYRQEEGEIVNGFIAGVCSVPWGPLPLFWMSSVLPLLYCSGPTLEEVSVLLLLDLVDQHMVYQEPILRGAAQHNLLIFILNKSKPLSKPVLESVLYTFWRNRVFFLDTPCWNFVRDCLLTVYKGDSSTLLRETEVELMSLNARVLEPLHIVMNAVIKCLLPLLVASSADSEGLIGVLEGLFSALFHASAGSNRAYAASRLNLDPEQAERLKPILISCFLQIVKVPRRRKGKDFLKYCAPSDRRPGLAALLRKSSLCEKIENCILESLKVLKESEDIMSIEYAKLYLEVEEALDIFSLSTASELLQQSLVDILGSKSAISKSISLKVALLLTSQYPELVANKATKQFYEALPLRVDFAESVCNREEQKIAGKFLREFNDDQLQVLKQWVRYPHGNAFSDARKSMLCEFALESLDVGGEDCVISAIQLVTAVNLPALNFVLKAHKVVLEFRKNEMFWPALEAFTDLLFPHLKYHPREVSEVLAKIMQESHLAPGIMGLVISSLESYMDSHPTHGGETSLILAGLVPVVTRGLCFGPTLRRDQRVITDTNRMISEEGARLSVNCVEGSDHLLSRSVRMKALNLLLRLLSSVESGSVEQLVKQVFSSLELLQSEVAKGRVRHFENSEIHRMRNRMMQAVLVISRFVAQTPSIGPKYKEELVIKFLDQLLEHNEQTSVRHLLEWVTTVLVTEMGTTDPALSSSLLSLLWQWLDKAGSTRVGAVPSFILIITNIATLSSVPHHQEFLEKAIEEVSPWSMAQSFGVRIVAQLAFRKLWRASQVYPDLVNKFHILHNCLSKSVQNSEKSSVNLSEDFYQSTLDPLQHYTLQDIYTHFPRLCLLSDEEIIPAELLALLRQPYFQSLQSTGRSSLQDCSPSRLVSKDPLTVQDNNPDTIQRKITPWKSMNIDTEVEEVQRFSKRQTREYGGLIVIASLIDRLPNLGGLCRTCEIFGVGKMTIPSAAVLKEKDFSGVSVTAEHWIPLEEVVEAGLPEYLADLRRTGWTIVAIEQANKSVPLNKFQFPDKCAILLGKEREGVPVSLLNLVDHCVEIPQHGLIRSFNVHVTGAMVLWEYVRQHLK